MKDLKNNTLATFPQIRITKTPGKAQTGRNVIQDGKPMYKRKDGKVVKRGVWSNTYLSKKQEGGMNEQQPDLMSLFSWFAENIPDDDFNSAEDVAKEFQQLSPEQQQQFVASIQQQMGTMQYGGMGINATPTKKYQEGGIDEMSMLGYSDGSPYLDYEMLPIDSNYLTMEDTGIPLMGVGNQSGEVQYMSPYSGDYYFPNDEDVTEYPLAQTGGWKEREDKRQEEYQKQLESNKKFNQSSTIPSLNTDSYEVLKSIAEGYGLENINSPEDLQRIVNSAQSTGWNLPSTFLDKVGKLKVAPIQKTIEKEDEWIELPNLNQLQSRLPYSISDTNIANKWADRMSREIENISNYQNPYSLKSYRNNYINLNEKNPNFVTPNQVPVKEKKFNTSNMNISDLWKKKQADLQNDISSLDPKIIQRDEQGNIPTSPDADWSKVIDLKKESPFEYLPMLQNYANALYQEPQFRGTANIKGAFTPELDVRGAIQAIDDELKDSMRNVDVNSTAGAAIAAQLQANASKNKLNIINDVAQKNTQIRGQNSQSEANRQNQQTQLQQQYDAQYYDNILRSRSASQQEKNRALNALLSRKEQKDAFETNLAVATMPYNNFKYKPGEGVFRNNKVEFQAPQVEPRKIEKEEEKKKQMGGWGNKFKFKNV